jgi:hypothetical protein
MRQLIIYGKLPDRIFLFKIPISVRQDLFETYSQFGQAPPKRFVSPAQRFKAYTLLPLFHSKYAIIPFGAQTHSRYSAQVLCRVQVATLQRADPPTV